MDSDEIALRPCTLKDCPALALVGAATFLEAFAGTLDGEAIIAHCAKQHTVETYTHYLQQPETRAWLAQTRTGGAPVGYALLTTTDLPLKNLTPRDIELKRIYLFSRFHGTGTGRRLLEESIAAARESGKERLLLGVYRENHRALAFYRRHGFVDAGVRRFTVGGRQYDDLILALPL